MEADALVCINKWTVGNKMYAFQIPAERAVDDIFADVCKALDSI